MQERDTDSLCYLWSTQRHKSNIHPDRSYSLWPSTVPSGLTCLIPLITNGQRQHQFSIRLGRCVTVSTFQLDRLYKTLQDINPG